MDYDGCASHLRTSLTINQGRFLVDGQIDIPFPTCGTDGDSNRGGGGCTVVMTATGGAANATGSHLWLRMRMESGIERSQNADVHSNHDDLTDAIAFKFDIVTRRSSMATMFASITYVRPMRDGRVGSKR